MRTGARRNFSQLGTRPGGTNLAPDDIIFGTAERLGIEIGHCWSHIFFVYFQNNNFLGCILGNFLLEAV
jgi:hypothetical protein